MKIILSTKQISTYLGSMLSIIERSVTKPILSNVLVTTKNNAILVEATDLDLYISKFIPAYVKNHGVCAVSAKILYDILRKINDTEIQIEYNKSSEKINIKGKRCNFNLQCMSSEKFPKFQELNAKEVKFKIQPEKLTKILHNTHFAMSSHETRYNLNGVCLHLSKTQDLTAAATDCHRLSISSCKLETCQGEFEIIIPKKSAEEFLKISKNTNINLLNISISDKLMSISDNETKIISKLIDGKFPNYVDLIPKNNFNVLTIDSDYFADAISRVSTITNNASDRLRIIQISINDFRIQISAYGSAYSFGEETIILKEEKKIKYKGINIVIGFNPKYLLDILKSVGSTNIDFLLNDSVSSAVIIPHNYHNSSFIIMPVKIDNIKM